MHWGVWIVFTLVALNAGWMAFDGGRALFVGDYITPSSGEYAGQLGPWALAVRAVGLEPRSTPVKIAFVVLGLSGLILNAAFLLGAGWARWGLMVWAMLGLWYLPFGTIINLIVIVILSLPGLRHG